MDAHIARDETPLCRVLGLVFMKVPVLKTAMHLETGSWDVALGISHGRFLSHGRRQQGLLLT